MHPFVEFFPDATINQNRTLNPKTASATGLAAEHLRMRASRLFALYIKARDYGDTELAARLIARAIQYEDEAAVLKDPGATGPV
jgi:hypothetical protein